MLPKFIKVFPHEYKRVLGVAARSRRSACRSRRIGRNWEVTHG